MKTPQDRQFTSVEIEGLEVAVRTLLDVTCWMDWWFYTVNSLAMHGTSERAEVQHLFVIIARTQLLVVKIATAVWANSVLKHLFTTQQASEITRQLKGTLWECGVLGGEHGLYNRKNYINWGLRPPDPLFLNITFLN